MIKTIKTFVYDIEIKPIQEPQPYAHEVRAVDKTANLLLGTIYLDRENDYYYFKPSGSEFGPVAMSKILTFLLEKKLGK